MFEWDEAKNRANIAKHGISFEQALKIFDGRIYTVEDTRRDYSEARFKSIGAIEGLLVVTVIHVDRAGRTRLVSARRANRKERHDYQSHIQASSDD